MSETPKPASPLIAIGAVLVPVIVAFVGGSFTGQAKNREVEGKFVELAVSILKEPPDPQKSALRSWAADILDAYSGAPLTAEARKALLETTSLPGASAATRDVQEMLAALGYYRGPLDGLIAPSLREAVSSFQRANGIQPDGIMGSITVNTLLEQYAKNAPKK